MSNPRLSWKKGCAYKKKRVPNNACREPWIYFSMVTIPNADVRNGKRELALLDRIIWGCNGTVITLWRKSRRLKENDKAPSASLRPNPNSRLNSNPCPNFNLNLNPNPCSCANLYLNLNSKLYPNKSRSNWSKRSCSKSALECRASKKSRRVGHIFRYRH